MARGGRTQAAARYLLERRAGAARAAASRRGRRPARSAAANGERCEGCQPFFGGLGTSRIIEVSVPIDLDEIRRLGSKTIPIERAGSMGGATQGELDLKETITVGIQ